MMDIVDYYSSQQRERHPHPGICPPENDTPDNEHFGIHERTSLTKVRAKKFESGFGNRRD